MQQKIQPLEEKLSKNGMQPYTVQTAMLALSEKIVGIKIADLANVNGKINSVLSNDSWIKK